MKNIIKFLAFLILAINFNSCESNDSAFDDPVNDKIVTEYSYSVTDINETLHNFVLKSQELESANLNNMSIENIGLLFDNYVIAGEQFVEALNRVNEIEQSSNKTTSKKMDGPSCSAVDFIPGADNGLGVGLAKGTGDVIKDANEGAASLKKQVEDGTIDDNEYMEKTNKLKTDILTKTSSLTLGAFLGFGAAYVTGAIVGTATLPAIATITVVGATVGSLVTWYSYTYATEKNKGSNSKFQMFTGKSEVGGKLPIHLFQDNATVVIAVSGYAPVVLNNFKLPNAGMNKIIDIQGVKLNDAKSGGTTTVCFSEEEMTASSCSEVEFVSGTPSPVDPAPGQGVTVTATLIPSIANCDISFTITGTDGYSNSATTSSDSSGQANFYIPGAAESVIDVVTISSSNGKKYTVTYVF